MKLYIMPYELFEYSIAGKYNVFQRANTLYQHGEHLFLLYSLTTSAVYYTSALGFELDISSYDIEHDNPIISQLFKEAIRIIKEYDYNKLDVRLITPNNIFIKDELLYILHRIGVKEVKSVFMDVWLEERDMFFDKLDYKVEKTDFYPSIYYQKFIKYLNHLIRMLFNRTSTPSAVDLFRMLLYKKISHKQGGKDVFNLSKRAIAINLSIDDSTIREILGFIIKDKYMIKEDDGIYYPLPSWSNRYIPEIYSENTLFKPIGSDSTYITEALCLDNVSDMYQANTTIYDLLIDLEYYFPQSAIHYYTKSLSEFLDDNECIVNMPKIPYTPARLEEMLDGAMLDIVTSNDINYAIRANIDKIFNEIKRNHAKLKPPQILGVCPVCEKRGIVRGRIGYFCRYCDDFMLWDATIEKVIPNGLKKTQMTNLLKPQNNLEIKIKNKTIRLVSVGRKDAKRYWKLEKKIERYL